MSFAQRRKISDFLFSAWGDMKIKDSLLVIFQNDSLFKVLNLHAFYSWLLHLFLGKFCSLNVTQFHSITYIQFVPTKTAEKPFYEGLLCGHINHLKPKISDLFSKLKFWHLVAFKPFGLQDHTVPNLKILSFFYSTIS